VGGLSGRHAAQPVILVDSSVWMSNFIGSGPRPKDLLDSLLDIEPLLVGDLVLVEVLQGFRNDCGYRRAKAVA